MSDTPLNPVDPDDAETYALEATHKTPKLPGQVNHQATLEAALDALAHDLASHATECIRQFGDFHIALPGGTEYESLYMRLMIDPTLRIIPWERTHVWILHELNTGMREPASVFSQLRESIIEHTDLPMRQVHAIHTNEQDAPALFTTEMQDVLGWREKGHDRLDYALVPPARSVLSLQGEFFVVPCESHTVMTDSVLAATRFVAVLAAGVQHRDHLHHIQHQFGSGRSRYPLLPHAGVLCWYLDHDACPDQPE
jgi:6-phosphogluconolactonase/glucosamine-6-phosphate isomerase/deaminase